MIRRCIFCRTGITACNGFCLARDVVKVLRGERDYCREICGRCVIVLEVVTQGDPYG